MLFRSDHAHEAGFLDAVEHELDRQLQSRARQIGAEIGVNESRVSQLHARAIRRLKEALKSTMSQYLVDRIERTSNIEVMTETEVAAVHGKAALDTVSLRDRRDGKIEWVDVTTGLTAGPLVEVFGDLRPGDEVAGRGTDELRPGTAVTPRAVKPAA